MFEENEDLTLIMSNEAVYAGKPHTLGELKTAIRKNIQEIGEETLVKVEANFRKRLQICARENSHHLSDIIFRS